VLGVTVGFNSTVARVPPGSGLQTVGDTMIGAPGMTIILGSSSAQVVTAQEGTASIVPNPGTIMGPCDLFIIVNAGPAAAQFDLQVVAAAGEDSRESGRFVAGRMDGLQSSASPGALLFAVPQGISSSEPAAGSHASACPDSSTDDASRNQASPSSGPGGSENAVSPPCASSKPAAAQAPKKPVVRVESGFDPTTPTSPLESRTPTPSTARIPEDKRSCQVLAKDGTLP
jgi:hypothetical protein